MKCNGLKLAPAVVLAGAAGLMMPDTVSAQTTIYSENFESVVLRPQVDEAGFPGQNVFTHVGPFGWLIDSSGVGGDGAVEWDGWSFARKDFWVTVAGDQERSAFTKGQGIIAIADPDEYDDFRSGIPGNDRFDAFMTTPEIPIPNITGGAVTLTFDSSWRPEGFDDGDRLNNQTGKVRVSFDGGTSWTEVLHWNSDIFDEVNYKSDDPANWNETVNLPITVPSGATGMLLEFGMTNADNDWWWAVDNLKVTANLQGAAGRSISGTLTREDCPPGPGNAIFVLHPSDNSGDIVVAANLDAAGGFSLTNLPAKNYTLSARTTNTLSKTVAANTTSGNVSGLTITALKGGDVNGDNSVDVLDLDQLIQAFDSDATVTNWNPNADFDCTGTVDVLDLDIQLRNFDQVGE